MALPAEKRPAARATLSCWPVVVNVIQNGYSLSDMEDCLQVNEDAMARGEPFITIRDVSGLSQQVPALQRRRLAQWQDEYWDSIKSTCIGVVSIMPSPVMRGVLRAIFWMSEPPTTEHVVDTPAEAVAWVMKKLEEHSVPSRYKVDEQDLLRRLMSRDF